MIKNLSPKHLKYFAKYKRKQPSRIVLIDLAAAEADCTSFTSSDIVSISRALSEELAIRAAKATDAVLLCPFSDGSTYTEMLETSFGWFVSACELSQSHDQSSFLKKLEEIEYPNGLKFVNGVIAIGTNRLDNVTQMSLEVLCHQRIAMRILCAHHRALCDRGLKPVVEAAIPLLSIIHGAVSVVRQDAMNCLDCCPDIIVEELHQNITIVHVKDTLLYIFSEILKNAVKATVSSNNGVTPVRVTIARDTDRSIVVNILDEGVGIQEINIDQIWKFGYTSSPLTAHDTDNGNANSKPPSMCGFGVGLSFSKIYVELFGGSIIVKSGSNGTVVRVILPISGEERCYTEICIDDV